MSTQDLHEVVMKWPYADANEVIVTGTFDQWSSSIRLARTPTGFEAPVRIPWQDKVSYKFVVDGRWVTDDKAPTENDGGFINNVYVAPPKPEPVAPAVEQPAPEPTPATEGNRSVLGAAHEFAGQLDESYETPTPATEERPKTIFQEAQDAAAPIVHAIHRAVIEPAAEFANRVHTPYKSPSPDPEEPGKTLVEEVQDVTANVGVLPDPPEAEDEKIETEEKSAPVPEAAPVPEREVAPEVPIDIVPSLPREETSVPEPTVVPGTTVTLASEEPAPAEASTHIPLASPKVPPTIDAGLPEVDAAPIKIEADSAPKELAAALEPAPPVLAAEPVTEDAEKPKEVVDAEPVAAVETAAAPTSVVNPPENVASDTKAVAPEVLAAPAPESETKEVVPVEETKVKLAAALEPAPPVLTAEPVAAVETAAAPTSAINPPENVASEKAVAPEVLAAPAPEADKKEVVSLEETKAASSETKPAEEAAAPAPAPVTNGHAKEATNGTQQTESSRPTTPSHSKHTKRFSFPGRRASEDKTVEKDKSPHNRSPSGSSKFAGSLRKKRPSLFGKLRDMFVGEKGGKEKGKAGEDK